MAGEKPGFVNVDELMRQMTVEQAAAYYGVPMVIPYRTTRLLGGVAANFWRV